MSGAKNPEHIHSPEDAERILHRDGLKIIFKHSTACPVSSWALERYLKFFENRMDADLEFYQVDVIRDRPASLKIMDLLGVRHESPQAILLDGKRVLWHASHGRIEANNLKGALDHVPNRA